MLFPLLSPSAATADDPISRLIHSMLDTIGVEPTPASILPIIVLAFAVKGAFLFAAGAYQYFTSSQITRELRARLVEGTASVEYSHLLGKSSGRLMNTFVYFSKLIPRAVNILIFAVIIAAMSWAVAALVVAAGLGILLVLRIPSRISYEMSQEMTEETGRLSSLLVQTIQGAKYLASTASFRQLTPRILDATRKLARAEYRIGAYHSLAVALAQPLGVALLAGVLYYQAEVAGDLAPAFVLILYLYRILTEFFSLQAEWQTFNAYTGGLELVRTTASELQLHRERQGTVPYRPLAQAIVLEDVSFSYAEERLALTNVSVRIPKQQTVAFVGESGSGKSTLVDLVTGVLRPQAGRVLWDSVDLAEAELRSYRGRIGYVSQDPVLFDDSVANNISLWSCDEADPACALRIREAARRAHCDRFLDAMPEGYATNLGERGVKLSGGQRQRIAIARELFKSPDLLILDEATSALDSESESVVQESIDELRGQMTIIVIAHRLSTIRNADYIYLLDAGAVVEHGSFAELAARADSKFRRMCELQNLSP
jgi:subfamily B ATP-binding cassette protein MsbA